MEKEDIRKILARECKKGFKAGCRELGFKQRTPNLWIREGEEVTLICEYQTSVHRNEDIYFCDVYFELESQFWDHVQDMDKWPGFISRAVSISLASVVEKQAGLKSTPEDRIYPYEIAFTLEEASLSLDAAGILKSFVVDLIPDLCEQYGSIDKLYCQCLRPGSGTTYSPTGRLHVAKGFEEYCAKVGRKIPDCKALLGTR